MDYEKKYKEALERAKKWYYAPNADKMPTYANRVIEEIFPELCESEDEKIKKELIFYLGDMPEDTELRNGITNRDVLAWLEKQGQTFTKKDVDDAYLRGISDAKHEFEKQGEQNYLNYENINIQQKDFAPKPKETVKEAESNLTPLERKVKDILFSFHINADNGISFDGTMAIVHNLITLCQQEQKPAWSEEDEKIALGIEQVMICASFLNIVPDKIERIRTWLKSLKERIGG